MAQTVIRSALITGASAGIGAEFASHLATQGANLILVARRKERLESLASELEKKYAVSVDILPADLSKPEEVALVEAKISATADLDLLVNNAGFGGTSQFSSGDLSPHLDMLQVHVVASVRLSHKVLPSMITNKRGWIINVASVAAFWPYGSVLYSSTKAFLVSFSQSLSFSLQGTGVRVQALCPGFTYTEFHDVIGFDRKLVPKFLWMPAKSIVSTSLKALPRGSVIVVPGLHYRLIVALARFPFIASIVRVIANTRMYRRRINYDQHS